MHLDFLNAEGKMPFRGSFVHGKFFILLICGSCILHLPLQAAPVLSSVEKNVFVLKAPKSSWVPASRGTELSASDQVRTGSGARATISFDDGSRIELGPNASFIVQEATRDTSSVKLTLGSLRASVSKALSKRFEVRTPTAVCSVRGTEFGVDVAAQGNTRVEMFNGLLAVADGLGNEVLLKDNQSVEVTDKGIGPVSGDGPREAANSNRDRDLARREVGLEMSKEEVQAAAALEARNAVYQQGKAIIDVNGYRVRIEEYIVRPQPDQFKLVVLNERQDRFDYFYYKGMFNKELPDDLSAALRQLPGCIGAPCEYFMTGYETARSNTQDHMIETTSGGHQVDVNNNGVAADAVTAAFDPSTDKFVSLAAGQPFYTTLYNNYSLKFNGIEHGKWQPSGTAPTNINNAALGCTTGVACVQSLDAGLGHVTHASGGNYTSVVTACSPPDCTYNEAGVMHQVVYAENGDGSVWEKYDNYIISDEGKVASSADFSGVTSGTSYKQTLLNWNYQTIVTASEFQGRKIDLAVEPKIFIQSGLIP